MNIKKKKDGFFSLKKFKNPVTVDIHSHLLPGIDDGVKTVDESIAVIKKFQSIGYTKLITTPHVASDSYPNTKKIIQNKLKEVRDAIIKEGIDINLEASAEYYIDTKFLKLVESNEILPFMNNYILIESYSSLKPNILEETIFRIKAKKYIPVLAHPERCSYMWNNIEKYKALKKIDVLFQIDMRSLSINKFFMNKSIYKTASKLIRSGMIDFIGSDAHSMHDFNVIEKVSKKRAYKNIFKNNLILNNL